jgi:hypothetical protein
MRLPALCLALALLTMALCCPAGEAPARQPSLFLARRGWHIDIGLPAADLRPPLAALRADFPNVKYLFFGFGDRHYLLARRRGASSLLAALWPGPGLVLVTALASTPAEAFGASGVIEIPLSEEQELSAQRFIARGLSAGTDEDLQRLLPGPYPGSLYLVTAERYSALHTCNTWAAQALQAAKLPAHSRGVVFASQLWRQARQIMRATSGARASADAAGQLVPAQPAIPQ